jgi:hypothetical protein
MNGETGKTLEQLFYQNGCKLPMAVLWFGNGNIHRGLFIRFVRHYWFCGPITGARMKRLVPSGFHDGTFDVSDKNVDLKRAWNQPLFYLMSKRGGIQYLEPRIDIHEESDMIE